MNFFHRGARALFPSSALLTARPSGASLTPRGEALQKESRPTQRLHLPRWVPSPTPPAFPPLYVLTYALRTRAHSYPQHWLLCPMGVYQFEFGFVKHLALEHRVWLGNRLVSNSGRLPPSPATSRRDHEPYKPLPRKFCRYCFARAPSRSLFGDCLL